MTGVIDVHGGREHVVALKQNGTVWAWGLNNDGQVGDGTKINRQAPVQVEGSRQRHLDVRTGHYSSFALKSDGTVWAWGLNNFGQLGDGTTKTSAVPCRSRASRT